MKTSAKHFGLAVRP